MMKLGLRGVTPTMNAFDQGDSRATVTVIQSSVVRRLTPTECERLQGFPDDWTAQRWDFKKQAVVNQADSNRYKQMGNAVAVPVVDWIVGRLVAQLQGGQNDNND
jgi:DNA (cytosine-5)-methyltransferase 1